MPEHHHRSTLKQQNKSFKGSSSSKRAIKRINKGKVPASSENGGGGGGGATDVAKRSQRANAAKQARDVKRQELLKQKRGLVPSAFAGPRIVAFGTMSKGAIVAGVKAQVLEGAKMATGSATEAGPATAEMAGGGKITLVETGREIIGFLDCMSVADILVLVVTTQDEAMDALGKHLLLTARNFALPSAICLVVTGLEPTNRNAVVKKWEQVMQEACVRDDVKVLSDSAADQQTLRRFIATTKLSARPAWQQHSQLLAQSVTVVDGPGDFVGLQVRGYVKSRGMHPDQLVHIPSYGTYHVRAIEKWADPLSARHGKGGGMAVDSGEQAEEVMQASEAREELTMEEEDNGMEGEQTWPSQEELKEARMRTRKVPKFMGEYASAWIPEDEEDDEDSDDIGEVGDGEGEDELEGEGEGDDGMDDAESAAAPIEDGDDEDDEDETMSMAPDEEERARNEWAARRAEEAEQKDYPDEVEVPAGVSARERFGRYRGLRSLRTSPWDPYENLPPRHHKIIHLSSPATSRAKALKLPADAVPPGTFVTLHIEKVHRDVAAALVASSKPLVLSTLAKYENRMGLVHFRVSSYMGESTIVRSKDPLVLVQGARRCEVRPVFSEASETASNHKMYRFLPGAGYCVASCYAPIWWGPSPVVLMQKQKSGALTMCAVGSTLPPNANRIILKRIVLSGLPFKIHKRKATIRFMFYSPEDVRWFKAVEVWTKFGRRGIVREALGTHGYMKCTFDAPIAHHDTVCMSLYKRVFPPYPEDPARQMQSVLAPVGN